MPSLLFVNGMMNNNKTHPFIIFTQNMFRIFFFNDFLSVVTSASSRPVSCVQRATVRHRPFAQRASFQRVSAAAVNVVQLGTLPPGIPTETESGPGHMYIWGI